MRVVLDTNVVVSGLLQAIGPSGQIVRGQPLASEPALIGSSRPRCALERGDGNWRVTFELVGEDVDRVDYEDYH